jgi:hypothetical protein
MTRASFTYFLGLVLILWGCLQIAGVEDPALVVGGFLLLATVFLSELEPDEAE